MPRSAERRAEERNPAEMRMQPVRRRPHQRNHDENAPQAVHDARNRGQQLDGDLEEILDPPGSASSHDRSPSPSQFATASSPEERKPSLRKIAIARPKRVPIASPSIELYSVPDDRRQDPELSAIRVPASSARKPSTIGVHRRQRLARDAENHAEDEDDREPAAGQRAASGRCDPRRLRPSTAAAICRVRRHCQLIDWMPVGPEDIARRLRPARYGVMRSLRAPSCPRRPRWRAAGCSPARR